MPVQVNSLPQRAENYRYYSWERELWDWSNVAPLKKISYVFRFRVEICGLREGWARGSWELVLVAGGKVMTTMTLFPGEYGRILWPCPSPEHHDTIQRDTCTYSWVLDCDHPFTPMRVVAAQGQLAEEQGSKHWSTHPNRCLKDGWSFQRLFWIF